MKVWYPTTALSNQEEAIAAPKLTKKQQKQAAFGGGAVLLLLLGAAVVLGAGLTEEKALLMAQAHVKDPAWAKSSHLRRPFDEYHAWEIEEGPEKGTYIVTARHYLVGPTQLLVDSEGVRKI